MKKKRDQLDREQLRIKVREQLQDPSKKKQFHKMALQLFGALAERMREKEATIDEEIEDAHTLLFGGEGPEKDLVVGKMHARMLRRMNEEGGDGNG